MCKLAVVDLETGEIKQYLTRPLPPAPLPLGSHQPRPWQRLLAIWARFAKMTAR